MSLAYSTHLGQRLVERRITRDQVDLTIARPESVENSRDGKRYKRAFGTQTLTAVVVTTQSGQQLVVSAWIDPPNPGTKDARKKALYQRYRKAKGLMKWWYALRLALLS